MIRRIWYSFSKYVQVFVTVHYSLYPMSCIAIFSVCLYQFGAFVTIF